MRRGGCVLVGSVSEYDDRPGPLRDKVLHNEQRWRSALQRAAQLAIDCGHLRDGDTDQYAFELYAIPLAVLHEAGLFGYERARAPRRQPPLERWIAAHVLPLIRRTRCAMPSICPQLARPFVIRSAAVAARQLPAGGPVASGRRRCAAPASCSARRSQSSRTRALPRRPARRVRSRLRHRRPAHPHLRLGRSAGRSLRAVRARLVQPRHAIPAAGSQPLRGAGYAVVAFDQPAHGRSGGTRTTLPEFAAHLLAVAQRFGPAAALIGHSLGGARGRARAGTRAGRPSARC